MDISKYSDAELNRTQYETEKRYAGLIRKAPAFSASRAEITAEAYAEVAKFVDERCARNGDPHAYGAHDLYISLIRSAVRRMKERGLSENRQIVFYEAGVGTGFVLRNLAEDKEIRIRGCDVYLPEDLKAEFPDLDETTVIQSLRALPDHSVDIIYWNDVMEHMPTDEVDAVLRLFARKCGPHGLVITVTPSRYSGPHDITRLADPGAREAHGLHLKEYALKEVLEKYRVNGLIPAGRVKGGTIVFEHVRMYYLMRVCMEEILHNRVLSRLIPAKIRGKLNYVNVSVASSYSAFG